MPEVVTSAGTFKPGRPDFIPKTDETRCFDGNVKVLTDIGLYKLRDLYSKFNAGKELPKVLSYNFNKGIVEYDVIKNVQKYPSDRELCELVVPMGLGLHRKNSLLGTLEHKIYSSNGWVEMKNICVGDTIYFNSFVYPKEIFPILSGMLLGDGCLAFEKRKQKNGSSLSSYNFSFCHGENQLEYFNEKMRLFNLLDKPVFEAKSGYCDNKVYRVSFPTDDSIRAWFMSFIDSSTNTFIVNSDFISHLTEVSLAFWYMDDGSIIFPEKQRPVIRLHSCAYSLDEINLLRDWLLDTYNIKSTIYKDNNYYSIRISVDSIDTFQSIVAPYMCDSMRYKLENKYQEVPYILRDVNFCRNNDLIPVKVISKKIFQLSSHSTTRCVFNIETVNNHNYFASRVLVHNCQSEPELLKEFRGVPYYITTKMDGSSHSVGYRDVDGLSYTSHNCTIMDDGKSSFVEYVKSNGIAMKIQDYAESNNISTLVVQGEWCGEGIQKNRLKLMQPTWFVFTVAIDGKRVSYDKMVEVVQFIGAEMVPVEEIGDDLPSVYPTIDALLERASIGVGYNNTQREGIVIRPVDPVYSPTISGSLSMKVLNNKYLLKNED